MHASNPVPGNKNIRKTYYSLIEDSANLIMETRYALTLKATSRDIPVYIFAISNCGFGIGNIRALRRSLGRSLVD